MEIIFCSLSFLHFSSMVVKASPDLASSFKTDNIQESALPTSSLASSKFDVISSFDKLDDSLEPMQILSSSKDMDIKITVSYSISPSSALENSISSTSLSLHLNQSLNSFNIQNSSFSGNESISRYHNPSSTITSNHSENMHPIENSTMQNLQREIDNIKNASFSLQAKNNSIQISNRFNDSNVSVQNSSSQVVSEFLHPSISATPIDLPSLDNASSKIEHHSFQADGPVPSKTKELKNISKSEKKKNHMAVSLSPFTWDESEPNQKDVPARTSDKRINYTIYKGETPNQGTTMIPMKYLKNLMKYPYSKYEERSEIYRELTPDWKTAKEEWGNWWELHIYLSGILYIFLSLISIAVILGIFRAAHYYILGSVLCIVSFGSLRAAYILGDAYNFGGSYPPVLWNLLSSLSWCCLSASLSSNVIILLHETQVEEYLKHPVVFFIVSQFVCSIISSVISGLLPVISFVFLINQILFPVWTWIISLGYASLYSKLKREALKKQGELIRETFTKLHIDGAQLPKRLPEPKLALTVNLVYVSLFVGMINSILQLIGIFMFTNLLKYSINEPWGWFAYQSLSRLVDFGLASMLFYISLQCFIRASSNRERNLAKAEQYQPCVDIVHPDVDSVSMNDVSTLTIPASMTGNGEILSSLASSASRAPSMLYNENGFIRFRTERDLPQDVLIRELSEEGSTRATAGSSLQSFADGVTTMSPFFKNLRRSQYERCSSDTVDTAVDRRYGSTCSSESAANSFDVTFFLHDTPRQHQRSVAADLSLDLSSTTVQPSEDITPDSAVYVDLPHDLSTGTPGRRGSCTSVATPRIIARSLLKKIRGSSFSLNANMQGYELLVAEPSIGKRSASAQGKFRLLSNAGSGHLRDSGLIHDCIHHTADQASQTDPDAWTFKLSVLCQTDS